MTNPSPKIGHVAVIGAGFSGTLQAINLARRPNMRVTLIERAPIAGEGLAFGAADDYHLLNVRAANMSAFPDDPRHFARRLAARGGGDSAGFAPRRVYAAYLRELLDEALAQGEGRLALVRGAAIDLDLDGGATIRLEDGRRIAADAAILAIGNLPPADPPGISAEVLGGECYKPDPWAADIADGLGDGDTILLVGTGLTMVDLALKLDASGFGGRIVAISRRGLVPRAHAAPGEPPRLTEAPGGGPAALLRDLRRRAREIGWRDAVDALRPVTQSLWANAAPDDRRRFLRHLRAWWDVHRHRIAPEVADRIAAMEADGRLAVRAGRTIAAEPSGEGASFTWRPRGADAAEALHVRRIVNCTGPLSDIRRTTEPLLRNLVARGSIRPDPARIGIDVDANSRTIARDGLVADRLFAVGPMTRGTFWEIVAVPDIRGQVAELARYISGKI